MFKPGGLSLQSLKAAVETGFKEFGDTIREGAGSVHLNEDGHGPELAEETSVKSVRTPQAGPASVSKRGLSNGLGEPRPTRSPRKALAPADPGASDTGSPAVSAQSSQFKKQEQTSQPPSSSLFTHESTPSHGTDATADKGASSAALSAIGLQPSEALQKGGSSSSNNSLQGQHLNKTPALSQRQSGETHRVNNSDSTPLPEGGDSSQSPSPPLPEVTSSSTPSFKNKLLTSSTSQATVIVGTGKPPSTAGIDRAALSAQPQNPSKEDVPAQEGPSKSVQNSLARSDSSAGDLDLRKAYHEMKRAYDDMKTLLNKSMSECMRLSDEVVRLESQARTNQASFSESTAAIKALKKEAADATAAAASAKKEAASTQKTLQKAQARIVKLEESNAKEAGTAELEILRGELSNAVRKAVAAVEAREAAEERTAQALAAREAAEALRNEADKMRREAQAEAHAALAAAEAERSTRAEAEGLTESLRLDQERRARVFNNAVKAAVSRVQEELEGERDDLQAQLRDAQRAAADLRVELRSAVAAADEVAMEAASRTADALAAGDLAASAEQARERAAMREAEAVARERAAEGARERLEEQLGGMVEALEEAQRALSAVEARSETLQAELEEEIRVKEQDVDALQREVVRQQERAEAAARALQNAEKQVEQASSAGKEAAEKLAKDAGVAMQRVADLESELQQLRASSGVMSLFQLPSKQDVLTGLGLEMWKDDRLRWKSEASSSTDVESASAVPVSRGGRARLVPGPGGSSAAAKVLGVVPLRMWLIVAYLSVLHIACMISFTRRNDVARLCAAFEKAGGVTRLGGKEGGTAGALQHGMDAALP